MKSVKEEKQIEVSNDIFSNKCIVNVILLKKQSLTPGWNQPCDTIFLSNALLILVDSYQQYHLLSSSEWPSLW